MDKEQSNSENARNNSDDAKKPPVIKISESVPVSGKSKSLEKDVGKALEEASEQTYLQIVDRILGISSDQLNTQNKFKNSSRTNFLKFFQGLLIAQFICVTVAILLTALPTEFDLSDNVIIVFISSVFVETLGVVAIMVKFVFDNEQEVNILKILHGVVEKFQKYRGNEKDEK